MDYASTEVEKPDTRSVTAEGRYELLRTVRNPYLERARECSRLTIPALLPPEGTSGASALYRPYQSTGADGVNNLAAKLLMTLFPAGMPFFRLTMDDFIVEQLAKNAPPGKDPRAVFETALGKVERAVVNRMEQEGARKVHFEALLHLIVAGNGLLHVAEDGSEKFFPLDRFVVCRDLAGNVTEIVVKECVAKEALPDDIRALIANKPEDDKAGDGKPNVEVFTWIRREKGGWVEHQEVGGQKVPNSDGKYPLKKCAWIPLRWTRVAGESYGRGRCEDYLGDLYSFEALSKAIVQFAIAAAKIVVLVDETGVTDKDALADAESGEVLEGRATDVTILQLLKGQDFQVAKSVADEAKARLERAFLMASSIQRQAERVTAEEIRLMAAQLEEGLGGVYSILSEEFQRPLVTRLMHQLSKKKEHRIPALPDGAVSPQIVTGLDGLGRNSDMQRLDTLIQGLAAQFGPESVAKYINVGAYAARRAASLGIDVSGLIRSDEEVQASEQSAAQNEMAGKLGPSAIKAVSDHAMAANQQQQSPTATQ
jgi:hypothetical protein